VLASLVAVQSDLRRVLTPTSLDIASKLFLKPRSPLPVFALSFSLLSHAHAPQLIILHTRHLHLGIAGSELGDEVVLLLLEGLRVQYQNFKMSLKKERVLDGLEISCEAVGNVVEDVVGLVIHPIMACFDEIIIMRRG
jgi:hypothetical protein